MFNLHVRVAFGPGSHAWYKEVTLLGQTARLPDKGQLFLGKIRV